MRAALTIAALTALGVSQIGDVSAQTSPLRPTAPGVPTVQPFTGLPANTAQPGPTSWQDRILTAVGGAALGAGIGFFMSQVDHSDWDEIPGRREASRGLWSALGGGVGLAVGLRFPVSLSRNRPSPLRAEEAGRSIVLPDEIRDVSADNAYQIVRLLRPEWLNKRPPRYLGEIEHEGMPVYLDDFWYGDLESMRDIHVDVIESIRLVPATVAAARWGKDHHRGVIQVITVG